MEKWVEVKGSNGVYFVSDQGRVKSITQKVTRSDGVVRTFYGTILKQRDNGNGYMTVRLSIGGKKKLFYVHRLVAEAFITKQDGLDVVNHKDFNRKNNCVSNLEWTTQRGNTRYSHDHGRCIRTDEWISNLHKSLVAKLGRPVIGKRISDGAEFWYPSMSDTRTDGFVPACVSSCCCGRTKSHQGYTWRYADAQGNKVQADQPGG